MLTREIETAAQSASKATVVKRAYFRIAALGKAIPLKLYAAFAGHARGLWQTGGSNDQAPSIKSQTNIRNPNDQARRSLDHSCLVIWICL
jgi:hypothetical protein